MTRTNFVLLVMLLSFAFAAILHAANTTETTKFSQAPDVEDTQASDDLGVPDQRPDSAEGNKETRKSDEQLELLRKEIVEFRDDYKGLSKRLGERLESQKNIEAKSFDMSKSAFDASVAIENLFISILATLIALLALFGVPAYFVMKKGIETHAISTSQERINKSVKELSSKFNQEMENARENIEAIMAVSQKKAESKLEESRLMALTGIYMYLSFEYWRQYAQTDTDTEAPEYGRNVATAIALAQKAVDHAEKLSDKGELRLISAKNSLVYHLASKFVASGGSLQERNYMLDLANEVRRFGEDNMTEHPSAWPNFVETSIYVSINVGGETDRELAVERLRNLLTQDSIDPDWSNSIREKYRKMGIALKPQ